MASNLDSVSYKPTISSLNFHLQKLETSLNLHLTIFVRPWLNFYKHIQILVMIWQKITTLIKWEFYMMHFHTLCVTVLPSPWCGPLADNGQDTLLAGTRPSAACLPMPDTPCGGVALLHALATCSMYRLICWRSSQTLNWDTYNAVHSVWSGSTFYIKNSCICLSIARANT